MWGGAQWLCIYFLFIRALLPCGIPQDVRLKLRQQFRDQEDARSFWKEWTFKRIADGILIAVLYWGGFWS